jgi:hypothetical protein
MTHASRRIHTHPTSNTHSSTIFEGALPRPGTSRETNGTASCVSKCHHFLRHDRQLRLSVRALEEPIAHAGIHRRFDRPLRLRRRTKRAGYVMATVTVDDPRPTCRDTRAGGAGVATVADGQRWWRLGSRWLHTTPDWLTGPTRRRARRALPLSPLLVKSPTGLSFKPRRPKGIGAAEASRSPLCPSPLCGCQGLGQLLLTDSRDRLAARDRHRDQGADPDDGRTHPGGRA